MICLICGKESRRITKGFCYNCYCKKWRDENYNVVLENPVDSCSSCNKFFNTYDLNGKFIRRGSKGLCNRCYVNEKRCQTCKRCGNEKERKTIGHCFKCKIEIEDIRVDKEIKRYKEKNRIRPSRPTLTDELRDKLRIMFVKWKRNMISDVDKLIVVDTYYTIYTEENINKSSDRRF